ncbi:sigma-70 family RNA polymerase sigma factor [Sedimentibacter sp. zth1]|uniref:sigma-70 family RNA polymerase sigma factor n=1 Tax=Sedimentibacter sp. zth1 TaxID=2816908 RepID=UPI001A91E9FB|nr:sigma-70 family RNA polymerase sigma factor [Sedimentibacter sp. zth1]QSX06634.1 sigma-70 family RNA polymerase sigma factor [Sedimentibacter sp. zth1]
MNKKEFTERITVIKKQLYNTAFLYLGNEQDSMEIVDESIFKAYKSLKTLNHPEYFNTWVIRILINECKQEFKRQKRIKLDENIEFTANENIEDFNYDSLPLKEAVNKLPYDLKSIIILRYFIGFTLHETAQTLNIPQGTVVTKQRKALKFLRIDLIEEESNE